MLDQRTRWRGGKMERDGTLAAGAGGASYAATGSAFEFTDYLRDFQPSRFLLSTAWSYFLLLSDLAAVPAGFVLAFFAAGLVDTQVFGWAYDVRPHEITARFIEFFGLALVLLGWLHRRGHYVRRVMFWTAAGDLLRITVFGMLLDGFAQFALQQNISRTWFLCIWLLLPLVMIGLRVLTRAALDLVGLWQRRVLIAGDVDGARAAQAVLLSDASMGYEIAGRVAIESVTEAGPGLSLAGLMRRHGASLLVFTPEDEAFQLRRAMVAALVRERVDFAIMPAMDGLAAPGFEAQRFFRQDALLLTYRMAKGWKFLRVAPARDLPLPGRPSALALWVRSDGSGNLVRMRVVDAGGQTFQCDAGRLVDPGWQYRTFTIDATTAHWGGADDGVVHYPLRLDTLLLLDHGDQAIETSGAVALAAPMLIE